MKLTKSLIIVPLACGMLWAQKPADQQHPAKPPVPAAKNAATGKPAQPAAPAKSMAPAAAKPAEAKSHPKPMVVPYVRRPAVAAAKPATKAAPQAKMAAPFAPKKARKAEAGEVKAAAVKETETRVSSSKMRDPFVSPVVRTGNVGSGCETGKRCLVVDQIVLKGIVKSQAGFIAVVENPAKRAYFMRENDPVFNGKIVKITADTVVFQEQVLDKLGKQSMREVVKKVNAPIV